MIEKTLLFTECMYNNWAYIYSSVRVSVRRTTILNSKRSEQETWRKCPFLSGIWLKVSSMLLKHGGNVESRSWFVIKNWSIHRMESASAFFFFFFPHSIFVSPLFMHCLSSIDDGISCLLVIAGCVFFFYSSFRATSAMLHFDACRSFIIEREIFVKFVEFKKFFFPR